MARARNIKPAFFDNDTLALNNDPLGRLLFIGLWTLADYNGNLEWRAHRIKVKLLPYDDCDVGRLAINLDKSGFVRFYSDGDRVLLNIPNFTLHQNPHKNERDKGAAVADYSDEGRQLIDLQGLTINRDKSGSIPEDSTSDRADSLLLNPESPILNPESTPPAKPQGVGKGRAGKRGYPEEFERAWAEYPKRAGGNPKRDACKAWEARVKAGANPDDILAGVQRYAAFCRLTDKIGTEYVKQGATFFGPSEHYLDDWTPPPAGKGPGQRKETPQERGERMARERGIIP